MNRKTFDLSSFTLHLIAMVCMTLDHLWATVVPGNYWMTCLGRIAYPIFAFLITEGWFHTRSREKYMLRLLVFALISEVPFDLMTEGMAFYPYHQNVLWTFLIALLAMWWMDSLKLRGRVSTVLAKGGITALAALTGLVLCTDYLGFGVVTVLVFYFFRGRRWYHFACQLGLLYWINNVLIMGQDLPLTLLGREFFFPSQGFALLALLPIWLYKGRQGPHTKGIQYCFYAFYPLHMLILRALVSLG